MSTSGSDVLPTRNARFERRNGSSREADNRAAARVFKKSSV
jgi:hypothetical protein